MKTVIVMALVLVLASVAGDQRMVGDRQRETRGQQDRGVDGRDRPGAHRGEGLDGAGR